MIIMMNEMIISFFFEFTDILLILILIEMKPQGSKFYAEETHGQKLDPFLNKGVGTNAN